MKNLNRSVLCVLCVWALMFIGLVQAAEDGDMGLLQKAVSAGPVIESMTIEGLRDADREAVRKRIQSGVGEPLDNATLKKDRARIDALEEFVVADVETEPAPATQNKVRVVFRVYYENAEARLDLTEGGALSVRLGPHQLLSPSEKFPRIGRFVQPEDPERNKRERRQRREWVRKAERTWEPEEKTLTAKHEWGGYTVAYDLGDDRVDMDMTLRNDLKEPIQKVRVYLSANFDFPKQPAGYWWKHNRVMTPSPDKAPPVVFGDYGQGVAVACLLGEVGQSRFGFRDRRHLTVQFRNVPAGGKRTVRASVRFGPGTAAGGDPHELVQDVYATFRREHPRLGPDWPDRRPIAALHPSSSSLGLFKADNPKNPRGWKLGRQKVDVTTEEGRERFRKQALDWAKTCVKISHGMNAQGVIVWSIEGQQYPHATSYIGSPDKIARLAPEMDAVADEFFKIFSDAGLRTGVCIRPQKLIIPDEVPQSDTVKPKQKRQWDGDRIPVERIVATLDRKLTYAKERWGCSIFYVDSNVSSKWEKNEKTGKWRPVRWEVMPAEIFAELARRHPDCLVVPEHEYFLYWAFSAPLAATPIKVQEVWSDAFSVNLMQHFKPKDPKSVERMGKLVERGDILLFRGWFNDSRNAVIREIYERHHHPDWHDPEVIEFPRNDD